MSNYVRGGYLDQKTHRPLSLAAAVAVNGAAVAALMLINPTIVTDQIKTFTAIPIRSDPPPPPPPKTEPQKLVKQQAQSNVITLVTPPVIDPKIDIDIPFTPLPPIPTAGGISNGDGTEIAPRPHVPVIRESKVDQRYIAALQPPYPPGKIRSEEEGVVVVRVRVGADGRVKEVQKVGNADEAFYRATAEQAMKRWRFVPATSDGTPVEEWKTMTVRFRLNS